MKGEDLYIKSGSVALTTDNAKDSYFDNFKVDPIPCFVDPFDQDNAVKYRVKTNRYRETYKSEINMNWEQPENVENPWIYKKNYFSKKNAMFIKHDKDKKSEWIKLADKKFDIGTIGLKFLFDTKMGKFNIKIFESKNSFVKFVFTPENIDVIFNDGKEKLSLIKKDLTPKIKVGTWQ